MFSWLVSRRSFNQLAGDTDGCDSEPRSCAVLLNQNEWKMFVCTSKIVFRVGYYGVSFFSRSSLHIHSFLQCIAIYEKQRWLGLALLFNAELCCDLNKPLLMSIPMKAEISVDLANPVSLADFSGKATGGAYSWIGLMCTSDLHFTLRRHVNRRMVWRMNGVDSVIKSASERLEWRRVDSLIGAV